MVVTEHTKRCSKCRLEKQPTDFYRSSSAKDGLQHYCKLCTKQSWSRLRADMIAAYGGKCECCSESTVEFLAIDHIHGNGNKHRKNTPGGYKAVIRQIRDSGYPKDKYRLLCHNCNCARGYYGYCPHQLIKDN